MKTIIHKDRLKTIEASVAAFKVGESSRGNEWENGPGEDMEWLINRVKVLTEALKFECGDRCSDLNPCNAKEVLNEAAGS